MDTVVTRQKEEIILKTKEPVKIEWQGVILSVQARTTVWRYRLDNRTHYHRGYNIFLDGEAEGVKTRFSVAVSEIQQQKHVFRIGYMVKGTAWTKLHDISDYADYYRAGKLNILNSAEPVVPVWPPYLIEPPAMATYEARGARMLTTSCYKGKCFQCVWAAMAAVEIEYDWGKNRKHRFESFCYGPKSCFLYNRGKPRSVPYKDGTSYDEGWLDDSCTAQRGLDD